MYYFMIIILYYIKCNIVVYMSGCNSIQESVAVHVTEGICIPLVAKPDLIRNVTIGGCGRGRST